MAGQNMRQLVARVPMTPQRRNRYGKMRFHDVKAVPGDFKDAFDIDLFDGVTAADIEFTRSTCAIAATRRSA
jgi:hypothetical protein